MSTRQKIQLSGPDGSTLQISQEQLKGLVASTSDKTTLTFPSVGVTSGTSVVANIASKTINNAAALAVEVATHNANVEEINSTAMNDVVNPRVAAVDAETATELAEHTSLSDYFTNIAGVRATKDTEHVGTLAGMTQNRVTGDTTNTASLTTAIENRQAGDTAETGARTAADSALAQLISDESSQRAAADTVLTAAINSEDARVVSILNSSTADLDSFAELAAAFQGADSVLSSDIASLTADIDALDYLLLNIVSNPIPNLTELIPDDPAVLTNVHISTVDSEGTTYTLAGNSENKPVYVDLASYDVNNRGEHQVLDSSLPPVVMIKGGQMHYGDSLINTQPATLDGAEFNTEYYGGRNIIFAQNHYTYMTTAWTAATQPSQGIYTSADGAVWTRQGDSPFGDDSSWQNYANYGTNIVFKDNVYYAVGPSSDGSGKWFGTSADGISWTLSDPLNISKRGTFIEFFGDRLVAVSEDTIIYSDDLGANWVDMMPSVNAALSGTGLIHKIAWDGFTTLVMVCRGQNVVYYSNDMGANWATVTPTTGLVGSLKSVVFATHLNKFVIQSWTNSSTIGDILASTPDNLGSVNWEYIAPGIGGQPKVLAYIPELQTIWISAESGSIYTTDLVALNSTNDSVEDIVYQEPTFVTAYHNPYAGTDNELLFKMHFVANDDNDVKIYDLENQSNNQLGTQWYAPAPGSNFTIGSLLTNPLDGSYNGGLSAFEYNHFQFEDIIMVSANSFRAKVRLSSFVNGGNNYLSIEKLASTSDFSVAYSALAPADEADLHYVVVQY